MTVQLGDGIRLIGGSLFNYWEPEKAEVTIEDLATALANVCRFSGHLHYFYSVAQHAVNTSYLVPKELAFTALMHDTAEAFTNDLPTPLKAAVPVFKELEVKIESDMARRFGFIYPLPKEVKYADSQMLKLEKEKIKRDHSHWDCLDGIETDSVEYLVDLHMMTPPQARKLFLARFSELTENDKRYQTLQSKGEKGREAA